MGLNHRHEDFQSSALPTELSSLISRWIEGIEPSLGGSTIRCITNYAISTVGTARIELASQVGDEPLVVYRQSSTIELRSEFTPYPQRCVLLSHCQTAAFSGFSLDWFSGYQQEEDSFVPAVHPLHEGLGPTWLNASRRDLRITANLSGLTWEDTTASGRQDLNLRSPEPKSGAIPNFATPRG